MDWPKQKAEDLLAKHRLLAESRPQPAGQPGRVVPYSQNPQQGLEVRPGTVVTFGVGVSQQAAPATSGQGTSSPPASVAFFAPRSGQRVTFTRGGDGLYRCSVKGSVSAMGNGVRLLLWVKPVEPPSDRYGMWYLQRSGNGVTSIPGDGTWEGVAQLGNSQYPPKQGYTFDLAVSIVDDATAGQLLADSSEETRDHPVGLQAVVASNLIVKLK